MSQYDSNTGRRRRRAERFTNPLQGEPSMGAPSPMPGKPAVGYVKPPVQKPQTDWTIQDTAVPTATSWSSGAYQANPGYDAPVQQTPYPQNPYPQQSYYPPQGYTQPSQGVPQQLQSPPQGAWMQGYMPPPQKWQGGYQTPGGQGWSQPVQPAQETAPWQGGYAEPQWNGDESAPVYGNMPIPGSTAGQSGSGGSKPHMSRELLIKCIAGAAVLVLLLSLTISMIASSNRTKAIREAVAAYEDRFCQGVYVDGIHLGGMTPTEAREAVQKSAQLKCDEWHVRLETPIGEYVGEINSYHLGMTVHVDDALNEAWQQGHQGQTAEERMAAMEALLETPYHVSTALPSSDTAAIDRILNEIAANIYLPAQDAYIAEFNREAALSNPFVIVDEAVGRYLDIASIKAQVYDMVSRMETGVIHIEPTIIQPAVTKADLERQTTLIGTAYTPISTTSTENRNTNIKRACELISGTIIEPGKSFSFNDVVGARSKNNGFKLATVYAYGKEEEDYGGGVCQVSSTLYVAAVRANMEITKRSQHGLIVGYTTLGLDATVNYDGKKIDFAFRNNTGSRIYIIAKIMRLPKVDKQHNLVICEIYGPALENGVTYDLVATQVEVPIPVEIPVIPDTQAQYVVYTDDVPYTVTGRIGYEVDSFKVKYVNGEEVERTPMYHDSYAPVQTVTYVGVSERPLATWEP